MKNHRKSRNISLWKSFFYQLAKLLKWDIKKFIPQDIKNNLDCRTIYKKRNCCFYYRKGDIMFSFNFIKKAKSIKQCKVIKCDCFSKQKVIYPSYHRKK